MTTDSIELKRTVLVSAIMTPAFREQLLVEARDNLRRLDENLSVLAAALAGDPAGSDPSLKGAREERERLQQQRAAIEWRVREIEGVAEGAEMPFRTFDSSVRVAVGDDFLKAMAQAEIVLRDWKVVEIRDA